MKIAADLAERLGALAPPAVVAISGFGGAGKSTLAAALSERLSIPVISADSFIRDRDLTDYRAWEFIDFERLEREVLAPFLAGAPAIAYGHFDWAANAVVGPRVHLPAGHRLIIVEGVGLLRPELRRYFAFSIWVACPLAEATRRGQWRDRHVYGCAQDELWEGLWQRNDQECHALYRPEATADYLFDNATIQA